MKLPVTLAEAVLGAKVDVPTPYGTITLRIPPRTSSGARLRVKGHGVKHKDGTKGDLYAEVQIVLPETIDDSLMEAVRKLECATRPIRGASCVGDQYVTFHPLPASPSPRRVIKANLRERSLTIAYATACRTTSRRRRTADALAAARRSDARACDADAGGPVVVGGVDGAVDRDLGADDAAHCATGRQLGREKSAIGTVRRRRPGERSMTKMVDGRTFLGVCRRRSMQVLVSIRTAEPQRRRAFYFSPSGMSRNFW